ncbi:hypothetical protein A9P82_12285 [Arachidicoccus ginsenosidimutans]|uniref:LysM peptidoglycan-binding domain-containing protein n=1 Tax=Arachidicoccus sp. BS20 TaxID=1850526 RepID=UPI0007F0B12F|nr:LysM peptidoglycan-binding domain-containing protein [Arachidicoccus sp. BS20]ANI89993.1 hypothetical protein A9P82_12285 [Arachidicoccus sp. BS20]
MKKIILFISASFIIGIASAQSNFVVHTIKDGETLSQLAKQYGTTVGDIMRLNKMTTDSKLFVGEAVKIPTANALAETSHTVAKGETLYQIARANKVTVAQLRDWNNIPDNTIKVGQVLRLTPPAEGSPVATVERPSPVATQADNTLPAQNSSAQSADKVAETTVPAASDDKQRTGDSEAQSQPQTPIPTDTEEGVFSTAYLSHANGTELITKGTAGIFKTASGWQDKKYYILMNDVTPGTIVKIQANGKTAYAKVLWNLGNVKQNAGLTYRISDAAANVLSLSGDSFDIIVSYYKSN